MASEVKTYKFHPGIAPKGAAGVSGKAPKFGKAQNPFFDPETGKLRSDSNLASYVKKSLSEACTY
jgi:hypothetical protein